MNTYNVIFSGCSRTGKTTAIHDLAAFLGFNPVPSVAVISSDLATIINFIARDVLKRRRASAYDRTIVDVAAWQALHGRTLATEMLTTALSVIDPMLIFVFTDPLILDKSKGVGIERVYADKIIALYRSLEYDPIVLPHYAGNEHVIVDTVIDAYKRLGANDDSAPELDIEFDDDGKCDGDCGCGV